MKIAVLSGKHGQVEHVAIQLSAMGHEYSIQTQGNLFLQSGHVTEYDMFIIDLDVGADSMDMAMVARVRAVAGWIKPILLLTARDLNESNVAEMFTVGADGYVSKPVRAGEFAARVAALLRRAYPESMLSADLIRVGDYVFDPAYRTIMLRGKPLKLSRLEFDLGLYFFCNIGRIVPRTALEKAIWGRALEFESKTLDTHIYRLRMKLSLKPENGLQLSSVYGQGFRLMPVRSAVAEQEEGFPYHLRWVGQVTH
ncbi:response regulator transcription factor [Candidimonas nitroreducens]|uniref:DNA-binding response regulator n=1 Tax=Candidimonas nitroreducens TaxID=683354 RepID=A0A225MKY8_9BURK|nr:response regulator transcription factor [Candidimonas nitroreducens]OWT62037.1 DNA-binding response regulator [Candidimonas nitroreducens]